jgi:hypothetical protein
MTLPIAPVQQSYRMIFTKTLSSEMALFSQTYKETRSKEFRHYWNQWIRQDDIRILIQETHAQNPAMNENTLYDKIYESMRYHHRGKKRPPRPPTTRTTRKKSTTFSTTFLHIIAQHIQQHRHLKPEHAYNQFVKDHTPEIEQEKIQLQTKYDEIILYDIDQAHSDIHYNKFKRNYKNKFQQCIKNPV